VEKVREKGNKTMHTAIIISQIYLNHLRGVLVVNTFPAVNSIQFDSYCHCSPRKCERKSRDVTHLGLVTQKVDEAGSANTRNDSTPRLIIQHFY
jgi:hypothetical protein